LTKVGDSERKERSFKGRGDGGNFEKVVGLERGMVKLLGGN